MNFYKNISSFSFIFLTFIVGIIIITNACKTSRICNNSACHPVIKDPLLYDSTGSTFELHRVWIEQQCLKADVSYSGGCGTATFALVWNGSMMKSLPPQIPMKIIFDDQDNCRSIIHKTLCFPLHDIYESTFVILLHGYEHPLSVEKNEKKQ